MRYMVCDRRTVCGGEEGVYMRGIAVWLRDFGLWELGRSDLGMRVSSEIKAKGACGYD